MQCDGDKMVTWHVLGAIGWRQLHARFRHADDSFKFGIRTRMLISLRIPNGYSDVGDHHGTG